MPMVAHNYQIWNLQVLLLKDLLMVKERSILSVLVTSILFPFSLFNSSIFFLTLYYYYNEHFHGIQRISDCGICGVECAKF